MTTNAPATDKLLTATPDRCFPLILMLFFGSGCSALIYEIVWFQLLRLVVGSSSVSIGVLLGTFMGGMCLGSLLFPKLVSESIHPLRTYAALEIAIGVCGLILLTAIPAIGNLYIGAVGYGTASVLLRASLAALCLLPPTILMGATLPSIARWVESSATGLSWLGFFYGANIVGAVFGCCLAGFYLLRLHDMTIATYVAVAINFAVGIVGLIIAQRIKSLRLVDSPNSTTSIQRTPNAPTSLATSIRRVSYLVIGISGACSLGSEVVWTRQLSLLLGASVYTFSIILAVFLSGLGLGTSIGSFLARRGANLPTLLATCQGSVGLTMLWAAYGLSESVPFWPIDPSLPTSPWVLFQLDLVRCAWVMLPSAILWGMSFPLALALSAGTSADSGQLVGRLYAANTIGAIVGALTVSMLLIASYGTQGTQRILIALSLVASLMLFAFVYFESPRAIARRSAAGGLATVLIIGIVALLSIPPTPPGLIAYGRYLATWQGAEPTYLYTGEGLNASIAVSEFPESGIRSFHVSGKVVASSDSADMPLQLMLGHLPALMHPQPKSALIVGCGAGVTAGTFAIHPDIERIVICEIEPLIPKAAGAYFSEQNNNIIDDPRVEIVYDDARHFIATTDETFDIITSDPIHPWVKGAAALYSKEYYELCKRRLNPGGMITQWVPLYESSEAAVKTEVATFFAAFPNGSVWGNDINGSGYDVVMLAQREPSPIKLDRIRDKLASDDYVAVAEAMESISLADALELANKFAGDADDLADWLADAELNTDANLRLQFLAGLSLNSYQEAEIYEQMFSRRSYPESLIEASELDELVLRSVFEQ